MTRFDSLDTNPQLLRVDPQRFCDEEYSFGLRQKMLHRRDKKCCSIGQF